MSFFRYKMNLREVLVCGAMLLVCTSCRDEDFGSDAAETEDQITVQASVVASSYTRSVPYIEQGPVNVKGTLLLQYRRPGTSSSNYYYNDAWADFGASEGSDVGFAYFMDGDTRKDLKWRHVYGEGSSKQKFYLSNLDPDTYTLSSAYESYEVLVFNKKKNGVSNNPYKAGPLDEINGTNDLLFGSTTANLNDRKINFDLKHVLSLLKINVEVYGSPNDRHIISLENAEVTITNLYQTLSSFKRTTPESFTRIDNSTTPSSTSSTGTYKEIGDMVMVNQNDAQRKWADVKAGIPVEGYGETINKTVYSTNRFVFPPQSIPPSPLPYGYSADKDAPKLIIKIPKADVTGNPKDEGIVTYSGFIPNVMFDADADGNVLNTNAQTIALRSGYQLNITAMINTPGTELTFAPVKIEAWVSEGTHTITGRQGGIFSAEDFDKFVADYKSGDLWKLEKYGYISDDPDVDYVFQFWNNTKLDIDKITNCLKQSGVQKPSFMFLFNGYTISLTKNGEVVEELIGGAGQNRLYNLVTGKSAAANYGIRNATDMKAFMNIIDNNIFPPLTDLNRYATMDGFENKCKVDITGSFEIDIKDIFMRMYSQFWGYDVEMNIADGQTVTVKVGNKKIVCSSTDDFNKLQKLCSIQSVGIFSPDDFYFLTDLYNNYYSQYNDILKLYGEKDSNGKWTFHLMKAMTLDGNKAYVCMTPDPDNGRPNYTVEGGYEIVYQHDLVPCTSSSYSTHYNIWSGTGAARSNTTQMNSLINLYNNSSYNNKNYASFWSYGKYQNGKWTFSFLWGNGMTCPYSTLFGSMVPNEEDGKFDYEFNIGNYYFTVTGMPTSKNATTTETRYFYQNGNNSYNYPNTAADLKKVARGTYWN